MKYTDEQKDVMDTSRTLGPGDVLKVIAFAGAGKTTTLKGVASARPERGLYLAFNKSIAQEARSKLALTKCVAETMHALAYSTVREFIGSPFQINAKTVRESGILNRFNMPRIKGWNEYRIAAAVGRAIAAFSASADPDIQASHGAEAIISAIGDPDFMKAGEKKSEAMLAVQLLSGPLAEVAQAYWVHLVEQEQKMSHDMYLKMLDLDETLRQEAFRPFRYLVLDEAQDVNPVQRSIIMKTGLPLIAVGDPYQQIYSWRGAENSLDAMQGQTRYLTQSFRFGENIAETARHILSIRPDGGPQQVLRGAGSGKVDGHKGSKVAVICRTNMGVIEEALAKMRTGISIHVDNMEGLISDVNSAQALHDGRPDLVTSPDLRPYADWNELKLEAEEGDGAMARLVGIIENDMVDSVRSLAQHHSKDPARASVMICTAHRSKGLEWPAVVLGQDWKNVDKMLDRYTAATKLSAKHVTAAVEEFNALYVAATRPIARLRGETRILFPEPEEEPEPV